METNTNMTAMEAIDIINNTAVVPDMSPDDVGKWDDAIRTVLAIARKEVPKKVVIHQWMPTTCACGYAFSEHRGDGYFEIMRKPHRCPECGQLLLWD